MRVAIVSPYALDVAGGVQGHVRALATALRRAGDEVLVLGPSLDGRVVADATDGDRPMRVVGRTRSVPANGSRAPIALGPADAGRLRHLLRRARPDVVHVHEPLVPVLGPVALLAEVGARVATFHASADRGALPRLYRAARMPARRVVAHAHALTAVSPAAAAFHARMLGLDAADLTVVPNGVDVARFAGARADASRQGHDGDARRLVFLGRLEPRKGADVALRAFLRLAPTRPDLQLRVLGDGPSRPVLERLRAAAPPDVAARVELAGRVTPAELPALLSEADVAVLPARGGESFGIVLLEAMAAGLAVVATDIPGYRDVARDGREAVLAAPDDEVSLAGAIARVLDDAGLRSRIRAAGAERAAAHDWSAVAGRMRGVYEAAVARASTRAG